MGAKRPDPRASSLARKVTPSTAFEQSELPARGPCNHGFPRLMKGAQADSEGLCEPMSTEATEKGGNPLVIFIISLCAAIVMAGGFAIVVEAFVIAAANLFELGANFIWVASGANALLAVWFAIWTFFRSWHVERRLRAGLEVDEPKMSILANLRG